MGHYAEHVVVPSPYILCCLISVRLLPRARSCVALRFTVPSVCLFVCFFVCSFCPSGHKGRHGEDVLLRQADPELAGNLRSGERLRLSESESEHVRVSMSESERVSV